MGMAELTSAIACVGKTEVQPPEGMEARKYG